MATKRFPQDFDTRENLSLEDSLLVNNNDTGVTQKAKLIEIKEVTTKEVADNLAAEVERATQEEAKKEPKLPATPTNPSEKYLNGNREWAEIALGSGGFAGNLYFTNTDSDVSGYKTLSYINDTTETEKTIIVSNSTGEVLIGNFLFTEPLETTIIPAGKWTMTYYPKVSKTTGITTFRAELFLRHTNGSEIVLDTQTSLDINNLDYPYNPIIMERWLQEFNVLETDRMGIRVFGQTDSVASVSISTIIGNGRGGYVNSPLALRHSQLRGLNDDDNYQHISKKTIQEFCDRQLYESATYLDDNGKRVLFNGAYESGTNLIIPAGETGISSYNSIRLSQNFLDKYNGQTIKLRVYYSIINKENSDFSFRIRNGNTWGVLAEGVNNYDDENSFVDFEYTVNNLITNQVIVIQKINANTQTSDLILGLPAAYINRDYIGGAEDTVESIVETSLEAKEVKTTTYTIKRNGTAGVDADFVGRRAIQDALDSITDASSLNRYVLRVYKGVYEATQVSHFDNTPVHCFIQGKNNVDLIGEGRDKVIISGYLPNNLGSSFSYASYQTVLWNVDDANIEGVTITGENLRYPLHIDGGSACNNFNNVLRNLKVEHKGNTGDALSWVSWHPIGLGMSSGKTLIVEDSILKAPNWSVYSHTNEKFEKLSTVIFRRCKLETTTGEGDRIILAFSLGSGLKDKMIFEDCFIEQGTININDKPWIPEDLDFQFADHAETEIIMTGHNPRAVKNESLNGYGLKIKSKSVGSSSSVRFDENSTAFPIIISSSTSNVEYTDRYNMNNIYGYQYKDGGNGLNGFAVGSLDIGMYRIGISVNKYIGALGKRLGDCSVINKTLSVIIDGINYDIVFDKNYNGTDEYTLPNYSNSQIIVEINNVIGSVATIEEYSVGRDYYPNFDNTSNMINDDTSEVLAGMGVVFTGLKTFRKALNSDNRIDGICLDDGRVGDECRVILKGQIFSEFSNQRFSIKEISAETRLVGVELGISATAGVFDIAASPKLLKAVGTDILEIK